MKIKDLPEHLNKKIDVIFREHVSIDGWLHCWGEYTVEDAIKTFSEYKDRESHQKIVTLLNSDESKK